MTTRYAQKLSSHMTCSRSNILLSRFYIAYFKLCHEAFWCILMSEHCENRILSFLIVSNFIWLEHSKKGMRESKQTIQQQKPKQEAQNYTSCAHSSTLLTLVPKPVLLTGQLVSSCALHAVLPQEFPAIFWWQVRIVVHLQILPNSPHWIFVLKTELTSA